MKVLVSKINPKEIEEKIAKAESVTHTLYKKEHILDIFESIASAFETVSILACVFYAIYVLYNWTIQVWAAWFLMLAIYVCARAIKALAERKFEKYNSEIDSVLILLEKMKKVQSDFQLQEQLYAELSSFNTENIVGRVSNGEMKTLYAKVDDHIVIAMVPINALDEDSNTVNFSCIDDEYSKVSQELDTCFEKIKEKYGRKALDNPRNGSTN